jgi:hypothetical protein
MRIRGLSRAAVRSAKQTKGGCCLAERVAQERHREVA